MNTQTPTTEKPKAKANISEKVWFSVRSKDIQDLWMATCRWHFQMTGVRDYEVELPTLLIETHSDYKSRLENEKALRHWANQKCAYRIENICRGIPPKADKSESMSMISNGIIWFRDFLEIEDFVPTLFGWYKETLKVQESENNLLLAVINEAHFRHFGVTRNTDDVIKFED